MILKRFYFIFIALFLFPASQGWAIEFLLSANPSKTSVYQRVLLTVKVTDGKLKSQPEIKGASEFDISNTGTSSSFSFTNGVSSSSVTYSYVLSTGKAGTYRIHAEGESLTGTIISNTAEITVSEANTQEEDKNGLDKIFIKVELSTNEAYVHQQLNYKLKFYTAYRIQETKLSLPEFEGFWVENVGKEKQYQETVNGQEYLVYEINKALFPQRTGTFELKPARVYCQVVTQDTRRNDPYGNFSGNPLFNDPFFSNPFANTQLVDKTVLSEKTSLEVKPLPESPEEATSDLAGNFHISTAISNAELKAGESTTLTVQVTGDGNLSLLELPEVELESAKIYKDKPIITQALHGDKIIYTKEFKIAIIPEKPGEMTLPTIEIPYFSIFEDKWLTMRGKDIVLSVSEGFQNSLPTGETITPEPSVVTKPKKVDIVGKDILPAYMNDELFQEDNIKRDIRTIHLLAVGLLILFVVLIAYYYRFHQPRFDVNYLRRSKAATNAVKAVHDSTKAEAISLALREFIGDKAGKSGSALGREEIQSLLESSDTPEEHIKDFIALYDELEAALYGGGQIGDEALTGLKLQSENIIQKLNKTL